MAESGRGHAHPSPYLLLALATLFWAANIVLARGMSPQIPPVAMAFWRWTIAGLVIAPFAARGLARHWPAVKRSWKTLAALGVLGCGLYNTMSYIGLQTTTATNTALFNSIIPMFIVPIAWVWLHERIRPVQGVGVLVSLAGVLAIVGQGSLDTFLHLRINPGDLWVIGASLLWAIYTVVLRFKPPELGAVPLMGAIVLFGWPVLALLYLWELSAGARFELNWATGTTLAYYGTLPSVVSYILFNRGVAALGANRGGIFVHLIPVYGIVLSAIFLGERPQGYHAAGIVLIFTGIYLTTARRFARSG